MCGRIYIYTLWLRCAEILVTEIPPCLRRFLNISYHFTVERTLTLIEENYFPRGDIFNLIQSNVFQSNLSLAISVTVTHSLVTLGTHSLQGFFPSLSPPEGLTGRGEAASCLSSSFWPQQPHCQSSRVDLVPGMIPGFPPWPLLWRSHSLSFVSQPQSPLRTPRSLSGSTPALASPRTIHLVTSFSRANNSYYYEIY